MLVTVTVSIGFYNRHYLGLIGIETADYLNIFCQLRQRNFCPCSFKVRLHTYLPFICSHYFFSCYLNSATIE